MSKNTLTKLAALGLLAFAAVQVHAFVNLQTTPAATENLTSILDQIESITTRSTDASLDAEDAIAEINEVIDQIDTLLDNEPANEDELLDLRDALVDMRMGVSGEVNPQTEVGMAGEPGYGGEVISDTLISSTPIGETIISDDLGMGFSDGFGCEVGDCGGGGFGGGGGGFGGFVTSPLGLASIGGIIALAVTNDDDDDHSVTSL